MSYEVAELFDIYAGKENSCVLRFLKGDNPNVTRVEIPAEYNGKPIAAIDANAFFDCKYLREVYIPDSVKLIERWAFNTCPELREIRLPKRAEFNSPAIDKCPKLAPKIILAAIVGNTRDITAPFTNENFLIWEDFLRPDVFALAIKYDSFREIGTERLFEKIVTRGLISHFEILEKAGKSPNIEETEALINLSAEQGKTEMTAYLLDYKNRKFGFKKGGEFDL